jgi:hypothetical protein
MARFGPKPLVHADYAIGRACRADSFWIADHQLGTAASMSRLVSGHGHLLCLRNLIGHPRAC